MDDVTVYHWTATGMSATGGIGEYVAKRDAERMSRTRTFMECDTCRAKPGAPTPQPGDGLVAPESGEDI
jgi:hypothetical protein